MAVSEYASKSLNGFGQRPSVASIDSRRTSSLPDGACYFRVLTVGANAPQCGCRRYWLDRTDHGDRSSGNRNGWGSEDALRCICGHHACFHGYEDKPNERQSQLNVPEMDEPTGHRRAYTGDIASEGHRYFHIMPSADKSKVATCITAAQYTDRHGRQVDGGQAQYIQRGFASLCQPNVAERSSGRETLGQDTHCKTSPGQGTRLQVSVSGFHQSDLSLDRNIQNQDNNSAAPGTRDSRRQVIRDLTQLAGGLSASAGSKEKSYQEMGSLAGQSDANIVANKPTDTSDHQIDERVATVFDHARNGAGSSFPADSTCRVRLSGTSSAMPSTIEMGQPHSPSPNRHGMEQATEARPPGVFLPGHGNVTLPVQTEDELLSPTELNTPSHADTPILHPFDASVHEVKSWIDCVSKERPKVQGSPPQFNRSSSQQRNDAIHSSKSNDADLNEMFKTSFSSFSEKHRHGQVKTTTEPNTATLHHLLPYLKSIHTHLSALPTVQSTLKAHGNRLDQLENASFSHGCVEEVQERLELMETSIIEMKNKWDAFDDISSTSSRNKLKAKNTKEINITGSFASNRSFGSNLSSHSVSTAMLAAAVDRVDMPLKIETLEARVTELEANAPSGSCPWNIEVVFLPWSPQLKGVWFPAADFPASGSRGTTQDTKDWAPNQSISSSTRASTAFRDIPSTGGWNGEAIQRWADDTDTWMLPRACGPKTTSYRRLCSRGLVCQIQINGPSAFDVQKAITLALGAHLEAFSNGTSASSEVIAQDAQPDCSLPLGLDAAFVPLRKIHKDSRLRYLRPEELVTPALWTVEFLRSSVIMHGAGGKKRLFITTPDGYRQHNSQKRDGITWQFVRQLPRVYAEGEPQNLQGGEVREGDAKEPCWEWNSRLDTTTSASSSFSSGHKRHDSHVLVTQPLSESPVPSLGSTSLFEFQPPAPISPLSEFPPDRQKQSQGTCSVPAPDAIGKQHKRRVKSPIISAGSKSIAKRRRISRSPTFEHSMPGIVCGGTPRRSNPPSPFVAEVLPVDIKSQTTATACARRGGTPFAYMTPHSGTVVAERRGGTTISTEVDSVLQQPQAVHGEDEAWEGVEEVGTNDNDEIEDEADDDDYDDDREEDEDSNDSDA